MTNGNREKSLTEEEIICQTREIGKKKKKKKIMQKKKVQNERDSTKGMPIKVRQRKKKRNKTYKGWIKNTFGI